MKNKMTLYLTPEERQQLDNYYADAIKRGQKQSLNAIIVDALMKCIKDE